MYIFKTCDERCFRSGYPWMEITTRRANIKADREMFKNYVEVPREGIARFRRDHDFWMPN